MHGRNNLRKDIFWLMVSKCFSLSMWRRNVMATQIMAVGVCGRGCSHHGGPGNSE